MKYLYSILLLAVSTMMMHGEEADNSYNRAIRNLSQTKDTATVMTMAEKDLRWQGDMIPVERLDEGRFYYLSCGEQTPTFAKYLAKYVQIHPISRVELKKLTEKDVLIVSYTDSRADIDLLQALATHTRTIIASFGNVSAFVKRKIEECTPNVVYASSASSFSQIASAMLIFGGIGDESREVKRIAYGLPSQVGMSADTLSKIDEVMNEVVSSGAAPGVHVLVARHGRVIYDRWTGTTMGDMKESLPLTGDMIYDMASVTKVMACLPFVMKLYDEGKIKLDDRLGDVMPKFKGTNKENMILADILTHRAGLKAWIPYYLQTLDENDEPLPQYYRTTPTPGFSHKVVDGMYAIDSITDTIEAQMISSPVRDDKKYVYSDFAFFIFRQMAEQFYGNRLDTLVQDDFYRSIGAWKSGYNPLDRFSRNSIVPSENEKYWRHTIVQGYVHDMAAAFLDGVSGHAGLFSTADDMAKMAQMYLWGGEYGGRRYINESTVKLFSSCYYCDQGNYRGLGFDRPSFTNKIMGPATFGHTGFTGTAVWIDPEADMIYIFLSNRTFESMNNNQLSRGSYRNRIQKLCYQSIIEE
ncbi:MAG: beta-lactamase family protein [Flavobacteriales bacterium]|nr:beta-lactamase family protein [Flavobacteriales bacterium]